MHVVHGGAQIEEGKPNVVGNMVEPMPPCWAFFEVHARAPAYGTIATLQCKL